MRAIKSGQTVSVTRRLQVQTTNTQVKSIWLRLSLSGLLNPTIRSCDLSDTSSEFARASRESVNIRS